jgi:hypothetical protein
MIIAWRAEPADPTGVRSLVFFADHRRPELSWELLHNLLHAPGPWRLVRGITSNFLR